MDDGKARLLNGYLSLHAVLLIGFGIAFALYGPIMMAPFTVPELEINEPAYWGVELLYNF